MRALARALADTAEDVARPEVRKHSRTLAEALRIRVRGHTAALFIPHYWAEFVNDGRRALPRRQKLYIWFKDPAQDPRFSGRQTPARRSQVRSLTRRQFRQALALAEQGKVVITRGPVRGVSPKRFFENTGGMLDFVSRRAGPTGEVRFRAHVIDRLRRELNVGGLRNVVAGKPVVLPIDRRTLRITLR